MDSRIGFYNEEYKKYEKDPFFAIKSNIYQNNFLINLRKFYFASLAKLINIYLSIKPSRNYNRAVTATMN